MTPDTTWQVPLPNPDEPLNPAEAAGFVDEVDAILLAVRDQVNARYQSHDIEALPTKTTRLDASQTVVLDYAFYLSFTGRNSFSYRLFELTSQQPNGGLPVTIKAFAGPPESFGEAQTAAQLKQKIDAIFENKRTRWVINTYYKS